MISTMFISEIHENTTNSVMTSIMFISEIHENTTNSVMTSTMFISEIYTRIQHDFNYVHLRDT